jgi:hypothetical protein
MDPIDVTATTAAAWFAQEALKGLGGQVATAAWTGLTRLVRLIRDRFQDDPQARQVIEDVQAEPGDQHNVAALAQLLTVHAAQDPSFREELTAMIADAERQQKTARFSTQVSGNAHVGKLTNIETVHGDVSF